MLLLEILLDVGRLVFDVKTGLHSVGNHPRAIAEGRRRRGMCETERKQEADPIRTSEIQILADHCFEEVAAVHGAVKHVGETEFDLPDREVMVIAGRSVSQRQRPWQAVRPAVEEGLDVSGPEGITRRLQRRRVDTREKAIVQAFEADTVAPEALLHPFMAIETEFDWVGQVGADLQKRRPPFSVVDIEVVVVDGDRLARKLEADLRAWSRLFVRFERSHLLLGDTDEDHPFAPREARPVSRGDGVLVLARFKLQQWNLMARHELMHGGDEPLAHRLEERGRGDRISTMIAEEVAQAA